MNVQVTTCIILHDDSQFLFVQSYAKPTQQQTKVAYIRTLRGLGRIGIGTRGLQIALSFHRAKKRMHSQIEVICDAADWHMSKDLRATLSDSRVPLEL